MSSSSSNPHIIALPDIGAPFTLDLATLWRATASPTPKPPVSSSHQHRHHHDPLDTSPARETPSPPHAPIIPPPPHTHPRLRRVAAFPPAPKRQPSIPTIPTKRSIERELDTTIARIEAFFPVHFPVGVDVEIDIDTPSPHEMRMRENPGVFARRCSLVRSGGESAWSWSPSLSPSSPSPSSSPALESSPSPAPESSSSGSGEGVSPRTLSRKGKRGDLRGEYEFFQLYALVGGSAEECRGGGREMSR